MKTKPSHPDPKKNPGQPSRPDPGVDRAGAGSTGGAPAAEEDVGTEGAGTEPRDTVDVERETSTSRRGGRNDKEAV